MTMRRTDPRPGQGRPQRDRRPGAPAGPPSFLSTPFNLGRQVMPKAPAGPSSQQATRGLDPRNRPAPQQRRMSSPFRSPPAIAPQGPLPQVAPGMPFTPFSPLGQGTPPYLSTPFDLARPPFGPPEQGGAPPFSDESPWDYFRKQYEKLPWWANPFSMLPPPIQEMPLMNPFNMWTDPEGWMPSNTPGLNRYERRQLGR